MEEIRVNKKQIAITLGIMCLILTFSIMIQLNTIKEATNTARKNGYNKWITRSSVNVERKV